MRGVRRQLLWAVPVAVIGGLLAFWYHASHALTPAMRADFEWFQTLGFPDVKNCAYVRVATSDHDEYDFLLASNTSTFTTLARDLEVQKFTNTPAAPPEPERVGFEVLNLKKEAGAEVQRLQHPSPQEDESERFRPRTDDKTEVFILAWACWRHGLDAEARCLYEEAGVYPRDVVRQKKFRPRKALREAWESIQEKIANAFSHEQQGEVDPSLRELVEENLAGAAIRRVARDFENSSDNRPDLLAKVEAYLRHFPHGEHEASAKKTAKVLRRMISEDQIHAQVEQVELARLPVDELVRELIFQLRDEKGLVDYGYGMYWDDDLEHAHENTNSPARQLVNLSYAAVPQLIAALDSQNTTRSVAYGNGYNALDRVMTVSDCAASILVSITGRFFRGVDSPTNGPPRESDPSPPRLAAEQWWAEFQIKGEKQMLGETVASAGLDAIASAELLSRR